MSKHTPDLVYLLTYLEANVADVADSVLTDHTAVIGDIATLTRIAREYGDTLTALERIAAQDYSGQAESDGAHLAGIARAAIARAEGGES